MNEETKPTPAPKAAVKPKPQPEVQPVTLTHAPPAPPDPPKPVAVAAPAGAPKPSLADFDAFLKVVPKEWLPTLMVRIANKCLAEKVFASPGDMAAAIVGASKGKK